VLRKVLVLLEMKVEVEMLVLEAVLGIEKLPQ